MQKITALGIAGGLIAYVFIVVSIAMSPWFNIYNNALSDLGNYNHPSAPIYNAGLIVSAVLIFIFALLVSAKSKNWKTLIWTVPLSIASFDLALIGVFTENAGSIHGTVSEIFFLMIDVTLFLYSYISWPLRTPKIGAMAVAFGVASAIIWFVQWSWSGVAIQESLTSAMTAIWLVAVSLAAPWSNAENLRPMRLASEIPK